MSKQIGQSQRSSDKLDAEKLENLFGYFLTDDFELCEGSG